VMIKRVADTVPDVPTATLPHPHTMKLGEFITHAGIYGKITFGKFLKTAFSRVSDETLKSFIKNKMPKALLDKNLSQMKEADYKLAYQAIQATELQSPSTRSVLTVGEESLSKSIMRLGDIDFFSVVARKPTIADFKPVVVEVALARFKGRGSEDEQVQLLRFANRVPLQFDKGACAITKAIESVNWRAYGLAQSKNSLPMGPYIFAISLVSPFIKFKNASKETIDASDELVEEIRLAVMRAGQKLSRHIKREMKADDLERKIQHIEQFGPILVDTLCKLVDAPDKRRKKATEGLEKILGRDSKDAQKDFNEADTRLQQLRAKMKENGIVGDDGEGEVTEDEDLELQSEVAVEDDGESDGEESPRGKSAPKSKKKKRGPKEVEHV
jgi:DNA topoisomerase VI subunit B